MKKRIPIFVSFFTFLFLSASLTANANLIINSSFETDESIFISGVSSFPTTFGDWGGDESAIVSAENTITPKNGNSMLKFISTYDSQDPAYSSSAVWQLVDLSSYSSEIMTGNVSVNASAFFNRVSGNNLTDTRFSLALYAMEGASSVFDPTGAFNLDAFARSLISDSLVTTWEQILISDWLLPVSTDYLAIRVLANENKYDDVTVGVAEFDGHYVDSVSVTINTPSTVPEPTSMLLFGFGLLGLTIVNRRRE